MARRLFADNAVSLLDVAINSTATQLRVMSGHGALYPTPGANEFFTVTLEDQSATVREIVHVTARNGDVFTVIRGQEGTQARAWGASQGNVTLVDHRITAATLYYLKDELTQNPPTDLTQVNQKIADLETALALLQNQVDGIQGFDPSQLIADIEQLREDLLANNEYSNPNHPDITNFKQGLDFLLDSDFYTLLQQAITEIGNRLEELEQAGNSYENPNFPELDTYDKAIDYLLMGDAVSGQQMVDAEIELSVSGNQTVIQLPTAYQPNSTAVYVGGLRQKRGVDFIESAQMELRLQFALTEEMVADGQNVVVDYVVA